MRNMENFMTKLAKTDFYKILKSPQFYDFCSKNGRENNLGDVIQIVLKIKKSTKALYNEEQRVKTSPSIAPNSKCPTWAFAEYKGFVCIIYYYCFVNEIFLNMMGDSDLQFINQQFPQKPFEFISFQYKCLLKQNKKGWVSEQDELLINTIQLLYQKSQKIAWKHVAYQMYLISGLKILKSYKECRQRWMNHLDPKVNRSSWSVDEDLQLFNLICTQGKRWSKHARQMTLKRTQHMIKNRFNSYIRKWSKKNPNKTTDFYISEIIAHLNNLKSNAERPEIVQNQILEDHLLQSSELQMKLVEIDYKNEKQNQYIQIPKDISLKTLENEGNKKQEQNIQFPNNLEQIKNNDFEQNQNQVEKESIQQRQQDIIDENLQFYEQNYGNNEEYGVKMTEKMLQNVQHYFEKDPTYVKVIDDTWLSQLEERENLKWLQD